VFENEIQDFLFAKKSKNQKFYGESARDLCLLHITIQTSLAHSPMSPMSSNTQQVPVLAISSNFDRRVHVVWGCREIPISPDDNRNGSDRQWMSSSIQVISEKFFMDCKSLSWAAFESGSQLSQFANGAFFWSGLTSIHLPASVTVIGDECFSCCGLLTSITFESGSQLSQLGKRAFSGSGVTSIHLPASVTLIGEFCFSRCSSLASITFESGSQLSQFADWAFYESGLTSIHLPASVTVIGEECFSCCGSLASITFDSASQLQEIHRDAFYRVPVEGLILPGGIRHLSGSAFAETRLETLSFSPLSMNFTVCDLIVEDISGRCLIRYFGQGDTVRIEWSIEGICEGCFMSCESVKSVVFEANMQLSRLEARAFSCSGVTSIHLPASVTFIGESCFSGCDSLASITFESGSQLSQLASGAFRESGLTSIHLPASVTVIGVECFSDCLSLASITFDPASQLQEIESCICEASITGGNWSRRESISSAILPESLPQRREAVAFCFGIRCHNGGVDGDWTSRESARKLFRFSHVAL
jgi:hypothetical protein